MNKKKIGPKTKCIENLPKEGNLKHTQSRFSPHGVMFLTFFYYILVRFMPLSNSDNDSLHF